MSRLVGSSQRMAPMQQHFIKTGFPWGRAVAVGGPLAGLATRADPFVFGPHDPSPGQVEEYWTSVDSTVATLRAAVRRRDRVLSLVRVARRRRGNEPPADQEREGRARDS